MPFTAEDLLERWPAARPFTLIGSAAIVAGGIVAAVSRPTDFGLGSWLAAYLVLVVGVAQMALGCGQAWLAAEVPDAATVTRQALLWNIGAAGVITGTLHASPAATTFGGLVSVLALVAFLVGVRRVGSVPVWASRLYRGVAVFVLASIPVGLVLSWVRHA
jgi:hypothetical protein